MYVCLVCIHVCTCALFGGPPYTNIHTYIHMICTYVGTRWYMTRNMTTLVICPNHVSPHGRILLYRHISTNPWFVSVSVYGYVYVYVHNYIYIYIYIIYIYMCVFVSLCLCSFVRCMHVCMYVRKCVCVCVYWCCVSVYQCMIVVVTDMSPPTSIPRV